MTTSEQFYLRSSFLNINRVLRYFQAALPMANMIAEEAANGIHRAITNGRLTEAIISAKDVTD